MAVYHAFPYTEKSLETYHRVCGELSSYSNDVVYKNNSYNIYFYISTRGYLHVLKVLERKSISNTGYIIGDYMLKKDDMLEFKMYWGTYYSDVRLIYQVLEGLVGKNIKKIEW